MVVLIPALVLFLNSLKSILPYGIDFFSYMNWRELNGLLGDGVAPSVEDVRDLVARVRSAREDSHDRLPARL